MKRPFAWRVQFFLQHGRMPVKPTALHVLALEASLRAMTFDPWGWR